MCQFYDFLSGAGAVIVDNAEIEDILALQFGHRGAQTAAAFLFVFGTAADESVNKFVPAWRQQKHERGRRFCGPHLQRTLNVDLEQDRAARREGVFDGFAGRAVAVRVVHGCPLEQFTIGDQAIKLLVVDEEIVDAINLARAWRAGGCRHRE